MSPVSTASTATAAIATSAAHSIEPRRHVVASPVLAMAIFIITEVMLFAAFISAFVIAKSSASVPWPPPGQARLPIWETGINSLALLASGYMLWRAARAFRDQPERALKPLLIALVLGTAFVLFQGVEWVALVSEGLTLRASTHGSFFYLLVGVHAMHAVIAIGLLLYVYANLRRGVVSADRFAAIRLFWYFVVIVWPVLYLVVYL